jgi:hypothetical protein
MKGLSEAYPRKSQHLLSTSGDRRERGLSWSYTNGASKVSEGSLQRHGSNMEKHLITVADQDPVVAYDIVQNLTNRMRGNPDFAEREKAAPAS